MLLSRQVHTSVHRATLPHVDATPDVSDGAAGSSTTSSSSSSSGPSTYQHIEISYDLAASPMCNQMMKYAWPSLPSVDVSLTLVLEARTPEELPERHLGLFGFYNCEFSEVGPQPSAWPQSEDDIPGECFGPRTSARDAKDLGSWQSTRQLISEEKARASERASEGGGSLSRLSGLSLRGKR